MDDGDKPKFKITIYADDDYYFASGFSKSSVSLSGSDGTVTSVSRSSSDTLVVYVTLDALDDDDSDHDLDVSGLEWDESTDERLGGKVMMQKSMKYGFTGEAAQ